MGFGGLRGLGVVVLAVSATALAAGATTIGGAMGNGSADARPIVWKNRDGGQPTGSKRHYLSYQTGHSYRYLGVHPADADPRMGVNEQGLAFGNCTASAFTSSPSYDYANTQALKQFILGETASVAEARQAIIDNTLGTGTDWPRSVALMPGISDATGRLVLFEIGDAQYYEYDSEHPKRLAQNPWQIYARDNTVHTRSDHADDWSHSASRYVIPRNRLTDAAASGGNTVRDALSTARVGEPGFDDTNTPSRPQTSTTMIAHGVLSGEDPRIVTMWNTFGQPDYAALTPVWVAIGDQLSPRVTSNDLDTSLSGASEKLFLKQEPGGYDTYINALLEPMEANFFEVVAAARTRWLRDGFVSEEARRIHHEASETAWHTMNTLAAGSGRNLNVTPELTALSATPNELTVTFGATAGDPDGSIVAYDWDFGDGSTSTDPAPQHDYGAEGTYLVRCRVTDDAGSRNSKWLYLTLGPASSVPVVTLAATDPTASEQGLDAGALTLTRVGPTTSALTVNLKLSGTAVQGSDYQTIGASATIPAGSATVTIPVIPLDDPREETGEILIATLDSGTGYVVVAPANATVTIEDDDLVQLFEVGDPWQYFKGTSFPGSGWNDLAFDTSGWQGGATGIGYGDGDDATELIDMQNAYTTVYLRREFALADASGVTGLRFSVDYDDGFVAFINGAEIERRGVAAGQGPATTAVNHEAGQPEILLIQPSAGILRTGANVFAIEVHNQALDSSDLSMISELHTIALPEPSGLVMLASALPLLRWLAGLRARS